MLEPTRVYKLNGTNSKQKNIIDWSKLGFIATAIENSVFLIYLGNECNNKSKALKIYETQKPEIMGESNKIRSIHFNSLGDKLIISTENDQIDVLDMNSAKITNKFKIKEYSKDEARKVKSISVFNNSPNEFSILLKNKNNSKIEHIDTRNNKKSNDEKEIKNNFDYISWSSDDKYLATTGKDCNVYLFNKYFSSFYDKKFSGHKKPIKSLSWSKLKSNLLISSSTDRIKCWDSNFEKNIKDFTSEDKIEQISFTNTNTNDFISLVQSSENKQHLFKWSFSGKLENTFNKNNTKISTMKVADGKVAALNESGILHIWDLKENGKVYSDYNFIENQLDFK